jgi:hypothetical protein
MSHVMSHVVREAAGTVTVTPGALRQLVVPAIAAAAVAAMGHLS